MHTENTQGPECMHTVYYNAARKQEQRVLS